jgi:hypothetical protein
MDLAQRKQGSVLMLKYNDKEPEVEFRAVDQRLEMAGTRL